MRGVVGAAGAQLWWVQTFGDEEQPQVSGLLKTKAKFYSEKTQIELCTRAAAARCPRGGHG